MSANSTASPLTSRAVLVSLNIRAFGGERQDNTITDEVHAGHGIQERSAGAYSKKLLAKLVKHVNKAVNAARTDHYFLTLPFNRQGYALLPTEMYFHYVQTMERHRLNLENILKEETQPDKWEAHMKEEKRIHNGTFNPNDYPTPEQFRGKYTFAMTFEPVPDSGHWVVDMETEELARLRNELGQRMQDEFKQAAKDLSERVVKAVKHLYNALTEFGQTMDGTERTKTFRDSAVTNITDILDILPMLNVTGDAKLLEIAKELRSKVANYDPQALREMPELRNEVARNAKDVLDKMQAAGYF